jgi:acyl transferase domain-containing protein
MVNRHHALLFSAYSEVSLASNIEAYRQYLQNDGVVLQDVAFTLATRRDHKTHRTYAVLEDTTSLKTAVPEVIKSSPSVGWIFPGQGAQWPKMGAGLIDSNGIFQDTIRKLDRYLLTLPNPPGWVIEGEQYRVSRHVSSQDIQWKLTIL